MGRGTIELKKIENVNRLQVSFTNRRKVLMKTATDLSILCDADVALIVFSNTRETNKWMFSFKGMEKILSRYGYIADRSRQREEERQLLLCSSQENGDVVLNDSLLSVKYQKLIYPQIESMLGRVSSGPEVESESSSSDDYDENDNKDLGKRKKLKFEPPCHNSVSQGSFD
ncbi:hypothetical protein N665_0146s0002 [Sinapis alba]|nr:hypothetical protein N665_0146s0002 [Sinapis alba]